MVDPREGGGCVQASARARAGDAAVMGDAIELICRVDCDLVCDLSSSFQRVPTSRLVLVWCTVGCLVF